MKEHDLTWFLRILQNLETMMSTGNHHSAHIMSKHCRKRFCRFRCIIQAYLQYLCHFVFLKVSWCSSCFWICFVSRWVHQDIPRTFSAMSCIFIQDKTSIFCQFRKGCKHTSREYNHNLNWVKNIFSVQQTDMFVKESSGIVGNIIRSVFQRLESFYDFKKWSFSSG